MPQTFSVLVTLMNVLWCFARWFRAQPDILASLNENVLPSHFMKTVVHLSSVIIAFCAGLLLAVSKCDGGKAVKVPKCGSAHHVD